MDEETKKQIDRIDEDIISVSIQGATNVAFATLKGMELVADQAKDNILENVELTGFRLSSARNNEPLARNAVRYVLSHLDNVSDDDQLRKGIHKAVKDFEMILKDSKELIAKNAVQALKNYKVILTHCHSSTSTNALIEAAKENPQLKIVSTETRPLYQGRKTAKNLLEAGVDVTQIVDSASASFIVDDTYLPVEAVIVGADEVLLDGSFINKVGTYQIALAAKEGEDDFYVATTLLKIDTLKNASNIEIEMRSAKEVWEDAPEGLSIINPSFELVYPSLVTGYITEVGILKAEELKDALHSQYPWV